MPSRTAKRLAQSRLSVNTRSFTAKPAPVFGAPKIVLPVDCGTLAKGKAASLRLLTTHPPMPELLAAVIRRGALSDCRHYIAQSGTTLADVDSALRAGTICCAFHEPNVFGCVFTVTYANSAVILPATLLARLISFTTALKGAAQSGCG
jgi:hypothetical protein